MNTTTLKQLGPSVLVALAALSLVSTLIVRTSDAAFRTEVSNAGNSFESGQLTLNSSTTSALFNVLNLEPGQSVTNCLQVTYAGDIPDPEPVSLRYAASGAIAGDTSLADYLDITVVQGAAGSSCAAPGVGTALVTDEPLSTFAGRNTYTEGALGFDPVLGSDEMRPYSFTVTLDTLTPNTQQNLLVTGIEFVWEITS